MALVEHSDYIENLKNNLEEMYKKYYTDKDGHCKYFNE